MDDKNENKNIENKITDLTKPNKPRPVDDLPDMGFGTGVLNGIFKGLSNLVEYLDELAEKAEQARARITDPDATEGSPRPHRRYVERSDTGRVVDFSYRGSFGSGNVPIPGRVTRPNPYRANPALPVPEPGNAPTATREPLVDIFDEAEDGVILVIAELPGAPEKSIKLEIDEDILVIKAKSDDLLYEKECLLPTPVEAKPLSQRYQNGTLEIRLKRI